MPFAAGVRCHSPLGLLLAATLATLFTAGRSAEFGGSWVGTPTVNISIIAFDENGNSIASGGTSNGEWITFTFTISESVAGGPDPFQASDIWSPTCEHGVNIAMECRFTTIAAGQIYTLTCGTEFASSVDLAINQSSFLDVAGNPNIGTELFTVISDTQGPTLTINATDEYGVDIPDGGARLGHIVFTITADEWSVLPGTAGPTGPSGGPPPGFGWYTDSAGQSCDDVCAVAGSNLTCSTDRPGVVDSEASLIAINQCVVARGEAGFSCGSYSEQGHHLMPGQYGDGGQCNYVPSGTTFVRCDGSHPNDHRLCCCVGIGEDPSTACPQMPTDCGGPPEPEPIFDAITSENCASGTFSTVTPGLVWSLSCPPTNGVVTVAVGSASVTDATGNFNSHAANFGVLSDNVRPIVALSAFDEFGVEIRDGELCTGPITFELDVNECDRRFPLFPDGCFPLSAPSAGDPSSVWDPTSLFSMTNCGQTNFTEVRAGVYELTCGGNDRTISAAVAADVVYDVAGNGNVGPLLISVVSDLGPPSLVITASDERGWPIASGGMSVGYVRAPPPTHQPGQEPCTPPPLALTAAEYPNNPKQPRFVNPNAPTLRPSNLNLMPRTGQHLHVHAERGRPFRFGGHLVFWL